MGIFTGSVNADAFLESMIDSGEATVNAGELRALLQTKRALEAEVKKLKKQNSLLMERNSSLNDDIISSKINKLVVTNLDVSC